MAEQIKVLASTETEHVASGWRVWALRIAITLITQLLLMVLVEAALRICGVGFPTDVTVPCTVQGQPASCYNLFFTAPFFPPGMIKTPQMYAIPTEKPSGTFRIVVLGESAAMGIRIQPIPGRDAKRTLSLKQKLTNTDSR